MRRYLLVLTLLGGGALAQVPAPPPPVNPGNARLDQTVGGLEGPAFAAAYHEAGGFLAAGCERGGIPYWSRDVLLGIRASEGTPLVLRGHSSAVLTLAVGGPLLASGGMDGKVIVWDVSEGKPRLTLAAGVPVRALAASPDGKILASAGDAGVIQLWDAANGKAMTRLEGHVDWVLALTFSPDGKSLASGGYDGKVRVWDVTAGKSLLEVTSQPPPPANTPPPPINVVVGLTYSPDGKTLAVGGTDANVHLLNSADGKIVRTLSGHTSSVRAVAFHPGGALLATGSKDRTVRLWNPANGQALKVLEGHGAWVEGIAFLAQGSRLASVGADETVRFWDLK